MPRISPHERLQPSLRDRLVDEHPKVATESTAQRAISILDLRGYVRRDIQDLLNTSNKKSSIDRDLYPHVANSVLNFGVPSLTGVQITDENKSQVVSSIRQAIVRFEPRLDPRTLDVSIESEDHSDSDGPTANTLRLRITSEMWAYPMPEHLVMRSSVDLGTGEVIVVDALPSTESEKVFHFDRKDE